MTTPAPADRLFVPTASAEIHPPQQILLVEADEGSRSVLLVALGREGFEVLSVSSASEAKQVLARSTALPEMMVVASELREENGFSLVAQLRGDRRTSMLPVLLLAKENAPQFEKLSRLVGADEILLKPVYSRDVATLARLQLCPLGKDGGRILDCATVSISHVLRAVLSTSRSGVIDTEEGRGHIAFRRGRVLDANFDGLHGINGLVRSLALSRGTYKVTARPLAFDAAFHCTGKELSSVVFPRLQRWEELAARCLPMDARLGLDFAALARALSTMPDAVNPVVRLFDGIRDVRQVLMDSPLDEMVTLEIATRLYLMGVVVGVKPQERTDRPRRSPRLFEPKPAEAAERSDQLFPTGAPTGQVLAEVSAVDENWEDETRGSGHRMASDPSEGWSTTRTVDPARAQDLAAEAQQQLNAFNIQPVVEHEGAPVFATDLMEFSIGETVAEQAMERALASPIPLVELAPKVGAIQVQRSVRDLEDEFFNIEGAAVPRIQNDTPSVSQAVLGLSMNDDDEVLPVEQSRISTLGWLVIVGLLVCATSITAWRLSANNPTAEKPATAAVVLPAVVAPETQPEPIQLATDEVEPLEPILEITPVVSQDSITQQLKLATRLYDEGKLTAAKAVLDEVVAQDPSNTTAWLLLGFARFDSLDAAGAEEAANTVLAIDPTVARGYLLRATILIAAKKRPEAASEIQKYLDLEPTGLHAAEAKALLKR